MNNNSSVPMVIFLASLILVAISAKAEEKEAKNENMKLIWTSDCPQYKGTSNSNMCKKKIFADNTIDISKLKWEDVEEIAKISYDWKYQLKVKFVNGGKNGKNN